MKKSKRLLSLLTALTISASAFAGLVIPASAAEAATLVSEDFSTETGTWGFTTASGVSIGEVKDGEEVTERYLQLGTTNSSKKTDKKTFDSTVTSAPQVNLSFKLKPDVDFAQTAKGRDARFNVIDSEDHVIFSIATGTDKNEPKGVKYYVDNIADATHQTDISPLTDEQKIWYTVNLSLDFLKGTLSGTMTDTSSNTLTIPETAITAKNLGGLSVTNVESLAPIFLDDVVIATPATKDVTINIKGGSDGETPVANAPITIGSYTFTTGSDGSVVVPMLEKTYSATIAAPRHNVKQQNIEVGASTSSVDIVLEYAGDPVATTIEIGGGDTVIYKPADGETTNSKAFKATVYDQTNQEMEDAEITWSIVGNPLGASINPLTGVVTITDEFQVQDDNGVDLVVKAAPAVKVATEVTPTKTGTAIPIYAIYSGDVLAGVTVGEAIDVTAGTAKNLTNVPSGAKVMLWDSLSHMEPMADAVTAQTAESSVSDTADLHINNVAALTTFVLSGARVIKDNDTATYSITEPKDQYGKDYTRDDITYTLETDNAKATVDGMKVTADNFGIARTDDITVTATSSNGKVVEKTVTVYGYDFYEPGIDETTYATNARIVANEGTNVLVWPDSSSGAETTTITLPEAVSLGNNTAKLVTFNNVQIGTSFYTGDRSLKFYNSDNVLILDLAFTGGIYRESIRINTDWSSGNQPYRYGQTYLGPINGSDTQIIFKTDNSGLTNVTIKIGDEDAQSFDLYVTENHTVTADDADLADTWKYTNTSGETAYNTIKVDTDTPLEVKDIAKIVMNGPNGNPTDRMVTLTNLTISDSDVAEVEIMGDDAIAKVSGKKATKTYRASIFSKAEGETFTWSVGDESGATVAGAEIDQNGVLSISDSITAEKVYVKYASDQDADKFATKAVTINDFATVSSFKINGPVAVNAGESATYSVSNIIDQYGDKVDMPVSFAITAGGDVASITEAGVLTTDASKTGAVTITATVGNPGKTTTKDYAISVSKFAYVNESVSGNSVDVDVTTLANYTADTSKYRVTTVAANGDYTITDDVAQSSTGHVVVDTTGAAKVEVSPIYEYSERFNAATSPYTFAVGDGFYDVTVKKYNAQRVDLFVNGYMIGQNIDQSGTSRSSSGSEYTAKDVKVEGGSAVISTGGAQDDSTSNGAVELTKVVLKKAPSIVPRKPHIYILGDSLVATYYGTYTVVDATTGAPAPGTVQTGWGQVFEKYIDTTKTNVTNLAESGNYIQGLYQSVYQSVLYLAEPGDIILFEGGYNDRTYPKSMASDDARYENMKNYMQKAYDDLQEKNPNVNLIFVTPNASNNPFRAAVNGAGNVMAKAKELGLDYIDLATASYNFLLSTGSTSDEAQTYIQANFLNGTDKVHSSYMGAFKFAELVAQGLYDLQKTNSKYAGAVIDTSASYTFHGTESKDFTMQVK